MECVFLSYYFIRETKTLVEVKLEQGLARNESRKLSEYSWFFLAQMQLKIGIKVAIFV